MATPIPGFASKVQASGETITVNAGSPSTLASTRWYYFVSNRTAATNGQSLLKALKDVLDAYSLGTWTVTLVKSATSPFVYRVRLSHNNGSPRTVTLSSTLALALGFAPAATATTTITVPASTNYDADYPSYWWWTPDMPVSLTGPEQFDHALSSGIPESAGFSQRAPDGTTAYGQNGVLSDAWYLFNGVAFYYKIRPQSGKTNQDLETWWRNGPAKGNRFLMWRDRDNACGSNAPSEGAAPGPYNYVEYAPQEALRKTFPAKAMVPYRLVDWDVRFDVWLTEHGETPLSD